MNTTVVVVNDQPEHYAIELMHAALAQINQELMEQQTWISEAELADAAADVERERAERALEWDTARLRVQSAKHCLELALGFEGTAWDKAEIIQNNAAELLTALDALEALERRGV